VIVGIGRDGILKWRDQRSWRWMERDGWEGRFDDEMFSMLS